jgi:hypothetical protein
MKLLISENRVVATATDDYENPMEWIIAPEDFDVSKMSDYIVVDGVLIYPYRSINKQTAKTLLQETDWTTIPDVADPAVSDPYLTNAAEFAAYRSQVRQIAVNPPNEAVIFPLQPQEVWAYPDA